MVRFLTPILLLVSEVFGREQKWKELLNEYTFGNKIDAFANVSRLSVFITMIHMHCKKLSREL